MLREHKCQPSLQSAAKLSITIDGETMIFCDKTKFTHQLSTNPGLQRKIDGKCQHTGGKVHSRKSKKVFFCQAWQCMPVIPALEGQRQGDF